MKAASAPVNPPFDFAQDMLAGCGASRHLVAVAQKDNEREERLAAALRQNLKRRKLQSRQMNAGEKDEKPEN